MPTAWALRLMEHYVGLVAEVDCAIRRLVATKLDIAEADVDRVEAERDVSARRVLFRDPMNGRTAVLNDEEVANLDPARPLRHYRHHTVSVPLADIPYAMVEDSGAELTVRFEATWHDPDAGRDYSVSSDASRVAALAESEMDAWREILDEAKNSRRTTDACQG